MAEPGVARRRRLGEELEESGLPSTGTVAFREMLVDEIDHALRPPVHERRVPSSGTVLDPRSQPSTWEPGTQLDITRKPVGEQPLSAVRRFADGLSSWLMRRSDGPSEWMIFDRPAGSERDLVVLANVFRATVVQRHPAGSVKVGRCLRCAPLGWLQLAPRATGRKLDRRRRRVFAPRRCGGARGDVGVRGP